MDKENWFKDLWDVSKGAGKQPLAVVILLLIFGIRPVTQAFSLIESMFGAAVHGTGKAATSIFKYLVLMVVSTVVFYFLAFMVGPVNGVMASALIALFAISLDVTLSYILMLAMSGVFAYKAIAKARKWSQPTVGTAQKQQPLETAVFKAWLQIFAMGLSFQLGLALFRPWESVDRLGSFLLLQLALAVLVTIHPFSRKAVIVKMIILASGVALTFFIEEFTLVFPDSALTPPLETGERAAANTAGLVTNSWNTGVVKGDRFLNGLSDWENINDVNGDGYFNRFDVITAETLLIRTDEYVAKTFTGTIDECRLLEDGNGLFCFLVIVEKDGREFYRTRGDRNGNGIVDKSDVADLKRLVAGQPPLTPIVENAPTWEDINYNCSADNPVTPAVPDSCDTLGWPPPQPQSAPARSQMVSTSYETPMATADEAVEVTVPSLNDSRWKPVGGERGKLAGYFDDQQRIRVGAILYGEDATWVQVRWKNKRRSSIEPEIGKAPSEIEASGRSYGLVAVYVGEVRLPAAYVLASGQNPAFALGKIGVEKECVVLFQFEPMPRTVSITEIRFHLNDGAYQGAVTVKFS